MESTARSTAPAADTSLLSLAIREEGNKLAQQIPRSSRAPSSASNKKVPETVPEFKCMHCTRTFKTARGRGGHVKAHKDLRPIRQLQKQKERRRPAPSGPQVRVWSSLFRVPGQRSAYFDLHAQLFKSHYPSSAGSGVLPLFAGTGTGGGLAPVQPSSAANGYLGTVGGGQVGSGGHLASLHRELNHGETAHGIHYFPSLPSSAGPLLLSQTGSGTSSLPQPLFAAPEPVAEGNGGTGDWVHLGGQQGMPAVNPEETTDGIDLTLRL